MIRSIIAAKGANNVIGVNNRLPWHLPADLKFFKRTTKGHFIIMGRKTFESLDVLLPGRTTIIITRNANYFAEGALKFNSMEEAFQLGLDHGQEEVFVLGGAEIYKQALDKVDRLYLTEIHADFDGDAVFPEMKADLWQESWREDHKADAENPYDYSFVMYERVASV